MDAAGLEDTQFLISHTWFFFWQNIDSHRQNVFLIFKILNVLVAQWTHNKDEGPNFH